MMIEDKILNFEESMKSLEKIVEKLEVGNQSLEQSLNLFEEGVEISKKLNEHLKDAEKKVNILINSSHNNIPEKNTDEE